MGRQIRGGEQVNDDTNETDEPGDDAEFWLACSQSSLDRIWDNPNDDVYAELLKESEVP